MKKDATQDSQVDPADRLVFTLDESAWNRLVAMLEAPPKPSPRLRKLLSQPSVLEQH